jgi:hypothetical protein
MRITRILTTSVASLVVAGALTAAYASPLPNPGIHEHSDLSKNAITVNIYNKGDAAQDVKIDGRVYSLKPHATITVKVPPGTQVFAASPGPGIHEGDMLFAVTAALKEATVKID